MIKLTAELSIHEGGTKYYQVFKLADETDRRGIVITHWGSYNPGAEIIPLRHGQTKMEMCERGVGSAYRQAKGKKLKRGYTRWDTRAYGGVQGRSITDIVPQLGAIFLPDTVKKIAEFMDEGTWKSLGEDEEVKFEASDFDKQDFEETRPELRIHTPVQVEGWGDW